MFYYKKESSLDQHYHSKRGEVDIIKMLKT